MSRVPRIGVGGKPLFGSLPRLCLPSDPCCETTSICDEENIIADFYWNQTTAPPACKIALINLSTNVGGSPIVSYLWETATSFGVFIFASTSEDYLIPDATNIVWVRLTVTTDNGCTAQVTKAIVCGNYECCRNGPFPPNIKIIYPDIKWVDPSDSSEHFGISAGSATVPNNSPNPIFQAIYNTQLPFPTMNWFGTTISYKWVVELFCPGTARVSLDWVTPTGGPLGTMFVWDRNLGTTLYGSDCSYLTYTLFRRFPGGPTGPGSLQIISPP